MRRHLPFAGIRWLAVSVTLSAIGFVWPPLGRVASAQGAGRFEGLIASMAAGADSAARAVSIVDRLTRDGIDVRTEDVSFPQFQGTNIIATVATTGGTKTLLLGAHYDRTAKGRGAIDNAASCAVVERLLVDLKAAPLRTYSVVAVFFDLEERGLVGSQAYFLRHQGDAPPDGAINLDIFGYGDTLFVDASSLSSPLLASLHDAAKDSAVSVRAIDAMNQYPASDHRIMMSAKIDTLGIALIDGPEVDAVLQHGEPRVATIIHTDADTIDVIRPRDMERAASVLERAIRLLDQRDAAGGTTH
jgi:Zn-dependent M28 family amino/carboxypeptidase